MTGLIPRQDIHRARDNVKGMEVEIEVDRQHEHSISGAIAHIEKTQVHSDERKKDKEIVVQLGRLADHQVAGMQQEVAPVRIRAKTT